MLCGSLPFHHNAGGILSIEQIGKPNISR